jgi:predicted MFS family arabinose efflux permease
VSVATPRGGRGIDDVVPSPSRVRLAVATIFFANGAGFATWIPHIPMVQTTLGLGTSVLGFTLLAMAAGALVGIPLSGRATARFGSRTVVRTSALLFFAALPLPVLAPSVPSLALALVVLGAGNGALDVSMNAQAVAIEARFPRPIMSSFHGMWSLGGLAGAGGAALALAAGIQPIVHVIAATVLLATLTAVACIALVPPAADVRSDERRFARPTRAVLGLGMIAFLALLIEGAMGDWSAVYLQHSLGTSSATAALGYAAFSLTMSAGRFLGDALVARVGDERVVRRCAAAAAIGLGAALSLGDPRAAIVGFATVGFGIANLIPIVFRAAGSLPGVAASEGIAAVGTFGYLGFLAGPPLIGLAADLVTLPVALGLVVVALAWIVRGARHVRPTAGGAETAAPLPAARVAGASSA